MRKLLIAVLVIECVLAVCISLKRMYSAISVFRYSGYVRIVYRELAHGQERLSAWKEFFRLLGNQ